MEQVGPKEVIDVDVSIENTMVMFSAIEELWKDMEARWKKLAVPLEQVINANNATNHWGQRVTYPVCTL